MNFKTHIRESNYWQVIMVVSAIVISLIAGSSFFFFNSAWTPLIVGGALVAVGVGLLWMRKPVWALYAAILVIAIPEGILPSLPNSIFNRFALIAGIGVWLLAVFTERRRLVWTPATLSMIGFLVWSMLSLLWAPFVDIGIEKIIQYTFRLSLFLILVVNEINSKETLDALMNTLALSGWFFVGAGFVALMMHSFVPGGAFQIFNVNRNSVAEYFLITMPGVLWQVMRTPKSRKNIKMLVSIGYVLIALILTALSGSRGGIIAIAATLFAFWLFGPTRSWGKLGIIILVVVVVAAPFIFSTVIRRFVEAEGGVLGGRSVIWQAAFKLIYDHPLTGVGIGNANRAIIPYLRLLTDLRGRTERALHNPLLHIWAETGLIGLTLYLGILVSAVWSFFQQYIQLKKVKAVLDESYFALIYCVGIGVLVTWFKSGGTEDAPTYFLLIALMLIPSCINGAVKASVTDETLEELEV